MYGKNFIRTGEMILTAVACLMLAGCGTDAQKGEETAAVEETRQAAGQSETAEETDGSTVFDESEKNTAEAVSSTEEEHILLPMEYQWQEGDMDYDPEDTIYCKDYYDDFVGEEKRQIEYPDINIRDTIEDYFQFEDDTEKWDNLVEMFFDYRTIEMPEEELKALFYQYGYTLWLQSAETENLHVRFVEIVETEGLSLYPARIMIQTWDEDHIYLQDITGPIPRKIESFLVVDDRKPCRLVVHSSGFSKDYVAEEELSFWEYRGTHWALAPMDLVIDTSEAHISGKHFFPEIDRDDLFEASYYRDGMAYRSSTQIDYYDANSYTVRLGKMEEVEKNKIFRLRAVCEEKQGTVVWRHGGTYIQFEIKSEKTSLFCRRQQEYLESDERDVYIDYPQLSGMADKEKEKRLNALIKKDALKILERDTSDSEYCFTAGLDYEVKYLDDRIISILYEGWNGYITPGQGYPATAMATTIDIEEEKILALEDAVADYDVLHDMLMADAFENTTKWDGVAGQHTVSQDYDYKSYSTLMEDLGGDDEDIEWYIDDGHFVIVVLNGIADYNEYAVGLQEAKDFLKKDFWQKIYPNG